MAVTTSDSMKPTEVNNKPVEAKETVVPVEPKSVDKDMVEIELLYPLINNMTQTEAAKLGVTLDAQGRCVYGPGKVTVDRATAQDLTRRQAEVLKSEHDRINGMDKSSGHIGTI